MTRAASRSSDSYRTDKVNPSQKGDAYASVYLDIYRPSPTREAPTGPTGEKNLATFLSSRSLIKGPGVKTTNHGRLLAALVAQDVVVDFLRRSGLPDLLLSVGLIVPGLDNGRFPRDREPWSQQELTRNAYSQVSLRVYVRAIMIKQLSADDWWMFAALVCIFHVFMTFQYLSPGLPPCSLQPFPPGTSWVFVHFGLSLRVTMKSEKLPQPPHTIQPELNPGSVPLGFHLPPAPLLLFSFLFGASTTPRLLINSTQQPIGPPCPLMLLHRSQIDLQEGNHMEMTIANEKYRLHIQYTVLLLSMEPRWVGPASTSQIRRSHWSKPISA